MTTSHTRQLLVEHYLEFYSYALAMLRDDDDARDAVQEAVTRTLARWLHGDPLRYCRRVVHNECVKTLRRRNAVVTIQEIESLRENTDAMQHLAHETLKAKQALPDTLRTMVEMHDIEGFTVSDLAVITGLSETTVRRRLNEAHELMRQRIKETEV